MVDRRHAAGLAFLMEGQPLLANARLRAAPAGEVDRRVPPACGADEVIVVAVVHRDVGGVAVPTTRG